MAPFIRGWEGNDWQEHVLRLLRSHYDPGQFQDVPDNHVGDFGIEGYSLDGCAYQCYAAQEPLSSNDRYLAQRDKITADLKKFVDNYVDLQKVLGATKVSRWILLVPHFDSASLVQHCQKKAAEVLAHGLSYVANDFKVVVSNDDMFAVVKTALKLRAIAGVEVLPEALPKPDVDDWALGNTGAVDALERKAKLLGTLKTPGMIAKFVKRQISHHLTGQEILRALHSQYGSVYEEVLKSKTTRENFLESRSMTATEMPPALLEKTLDDYIAELRSLEVVSPRTAEFLAHEAVADWLIRCPLEFPENS